MRRTWKLETVIAAMVVLMAAPLLMAKDVHKSDQRVTVVAGDQVQELSVKDLKDGETRTIKGPEGDITVTREGDSLKVTLPNEEPLTVPGEKGHVFVVSGDDDSGEKVKRWVTVRSDDEGKRDVETYVLRGDDGTTIDLESVPLCSHGDHRVLYRCPDDDVELWVPKKDATKESFTCPVCGAAMTKVDQKTKVRKRVTVKVETDAEGGDE